MDNDTSRTGTIGTLINTMTWPLKTIGSRLSDAVVTPIGERLDVDDTIDQALAPIRTRLDALVGEVATRVAAEVTADTKRQLDTNTSRLSKDVTADVKKALNPIISELASLSVQIREVREEIAELRTQYAADQAKAKV